jgi:hypothetical protein
MQRERMKKGFGQISSKQTDVMVEACQRSRLRGVCLACD